MRERKLFLGSVARHTTKPVKDNHSLHERKHKRETLLVFSANTNTLSNMTRRMRMISRDEEYQNVWREGDNITHSRGRWRYRPRFPARITPKRLRAAGNDGGGFATRSRARGAIDADGEATTRAEKLSTGESCIEKMGRND